MAIGEAGRYDNRLQQTRWRLPKPDVTTIGYSTMAIGEAGRYDNRLQQTRWRLPKPDATTIGSSRHDGDCRSRTLRQSATADTMAIAEAGASTVRSKPDTTTTAFLRNRDVQLGSIQHGSIVIAGRPLHERRDILLDDCVVQLFAVDGDANRLSGINDIR